MLIPASRGNSTAAAWASVRLNEPRPMVYCPYIRADRVLYTPDRLQKIAAQANAPDGVFGLNDRIGLVHDAMALAKSGHLDISAVLALVIA